MDPRFVHEIDALNKYNNCEDGGVLDNTLYFGMGLFSNCPASSCTQTGNLTCTSKCPVMYGCGLAFNKPVTDLRPYHVIIEPISPNDEPIKFDVTYSYFSPRPFGLDCNYEGTYPTNRNDSRELVDCMTKMCFSKFNTLPGDISSCLCVIDPNEFDLQWNSLSNQPIASTDLVNGVYTPLGNIIGDTWELYTKTKIPSNYSCYGTCKIICNENTN